MNKGTITIFRLNRTPIENFGKVNLRLDRIENQGCIIRDVAIETNPDNKDENYYDVEFSNGLILHAISGTHLSKPLSKGDLGGECNRTVCREFNARWFNSSTRKHYCTTCKNLITQWPENANLLTFIP